jgi:hypothetical protein
METETYGSSSTPILKQIFFNDRGLRAGWRLLIYSGMIFILVWSAGLIAKRVASGQSKGTTSSDFMRTIFQAIAELILFLMLLFLAWIMSKIERRKLGAYGLPLQTSAISGFIRGYFLWGFLPLAILLSILRALHVFYFGNLSPLNSFFSCSWDCLKNIHSVAIFSTLWPMALASGPPPLSRPYCSPERTWAMVVKQELESSPRGSLPCSRRPPSGVPETYGLPWAPMQAGIGDSHFSLA